MTSSRLHFDRAASQPSPTMPQDPSSPILTEQSPSSAGGSRAEADWLIITAPLTTETRSMINEERLSKLKPGARVVNVSRGEILDQPALVARLQSGAIAGAVLAVFDEEPLPESNPLWEMTNVYLLPHTTWRSPEVRQRQIDLFLDNAARFSRGEAMRNVVDVTAGY